MTNKIFDIFKLQNNRILAYTSACFSITAFYGIILGYYILGLYIMLLSLISFLHWRFYKTSGVMNYFDKILGRILLVMFITFSIYYKFRIYTFFVGFTLSFLYLMSVAVSIDVPDDDPIYVKYHFVFHLNTILLIFCTIYEVSSKI